jgi:hypothetical protein
MILITDNKLHSKYNKCVKTLRNFQNLVINILLITLFTYEVNQIFKLKEVVGMCAKQL